jgi:hypothetical protein
MDTCKADVSRPLKEAFKELASSVWLGREYDRAPENAGLVLKAVGALHAMRVDVLPVLNRKFSSYGLQYQGPEVPFLDFDVELQRPVSLHLQLTTALQAAKAGHLDAFGFHMMTYLDLLILRKSQRTVFESPYELMWLLEGLAGVMAGRLRRFHQTVVPTSVIYGFLSRFPALSQATIGRPKRGEYAKCERILLGVGECAAWLARLLKANRFAKLSSDLSLLAQLRLRELLVWVAVQLGIGKPQTLDILTLVERLEIPGLKLPEPAVRAFLEGRAWKALFASMCELRVGSLDPLVLVTRPDVLGETPWYAEFVKKEVAFQEDGTISMREKTLNPNAPAFVPTSVLLAKQKAAKAEEVRAVVVTRSWPSTSG